MRKSYLGFSLLLMVALTVPALSQGPSAKSEYESYMGFFSEKVPQKQAELGEKFLVDNKESGFRIDAYTLLVKAYTQAQNWAKVMDAADRFKAEFPNADPKKKIFVFQNAMVAGQQANNFEKIISYGDTVLSIDPNDLNALITISSMLPERLPQDEAGKKASLDKSATLATKALGIVQQYFSQPKPAGFSDADWAKERANLEGQLHSTLGLVHLTRQEYDKSAEEYELALKSTPKDGVAHFRMGLAFQYLASNASRSLLDAIKEENSAKTSRADRMLLDEIVAKRQAIEEEVRLKRDRAIDELATAVAIGGVVAQPARDQLEKLYKAKNNDSLDGLDKLINDKKSQVASMQ